MRRGLRVALFAVAALFGAALLGLVVLRMAPVSPERAAALRLLDAPTPPVAGRDGSDALWLLGHDVPANERAAVATAFRRWADVQGHDARDGAAAAPDPRERWPRFADVEAGTPGACDLLADDCLAQVRRDPAATAMLLARHAPQLRAARELTGFDGVRHGVQPGTAMELPSYSRGRILAYTALAERFARGEHVAAISDTCNDLAGWRRLAADNDQLVGSTIATAFARQDLLLLARMLAELPSDVPLPGECNAALAATTPAELDLCPAMRTEFAFVRDALPREIEASADFSERILGATFDPAHFAAVVAPRYAHLCTPQARAAALADASLRTLPLPAAHCGRLESAAFPVDCILAAVAGDGGFAAFADRRTDLAAQLALMRTWLWLRAQDPDPAAWAALLPGRPPSLGLRREARVDATGAVLQIEQLHTQRSPTFSLPLPSADPDR